MPLIAVVNKKRQLASSHFSQSLWQRLPPLPLLLLQLLLCLQLVAVLPANCKCVPVPVRWSTSHPFSQAREHREHSLTRPGRHSSIHSLGHSLIQPFSQPLGRPVMQSVHPRRSFARTAAGRWQSVQPGGRAASKSTICCGLPELPVSVSQLHHHHVASTLLAVACCEFNDAAHSTVIKSVWHFNLKAATFHMPHAACRMQQQAGALQRTLNTLLA